MSDAVCSVIGTDKQNIIRKFVFIKENAGSNANFILSCLLAGELNKDNSVIFLIVHNTFGHYHNVGMRLGYNLQQLREKNCVDTVEFMKLIEEEKFDIFSQNKQNIMTDLYFLLKRKIENTKSSSSNPTCLVIDEITSFLYLGIKLSDVVLFVQSCRTLLDTHNMSLVILSHVVDCEEHNVLAATLGHVADISITTKGLKTGQSKEVSGFLEINHSTDHWNVQNCYHYKLQDKQILVFAPGMVF